MSSDKEAKTVIEKVKKSFPISVKSRLVSLNIIIKQSNQGDTEHNSKNSTGEYQKIEKIIDSTSTRTVQLIEGCQTP